MQAFVEAQVCYSGTIFVSELYPVYFVYMTPMNIKLITVSFLCLIAPDQCFVIISPLFGGDDLFGAADYLQHR